MDIQDLINNVNKATQAQRVNYHVTLGDFIEFLKEVPQGNSSVHFEDGTGITHPHSYRGYYSDLAIDGTSVETSVNNVLGLLVRARNREFTAYKGGTYTFDDSTPMWRASWGNTGLPIINVEEEASGVVVITGEE